MVTREVETTVEAVTITVAVATAEVVAALTSGAAIEREAGIAELMKGDGERISIPTGTASGTSTEGAEVVGTTVKSSAGLKGI